MIATLMTLENDAYNCLLSLAREARNMTIWITEDIKIQ